MTKLRQPTTTLFSLKFEPVATVVLDRNTFYSQVNHQYNVLVVGESTSLIFFDLKTRKELFKYTFDNTVYYFEIHGDDLLISFSSNRLMRFNFQKIYNREPLSECKIWESHLFKYLWGFTIRRDLIYVCDFDQDEISVLDYNTGETVKNVKTPKIDKAANICFTPWNEMIISGLGFLVLLTLNENNEWVISKKYSPSSGNMGFYSLFYEERSQLIYISNSDSKVLIFDRELNLRQESKQSGKGSTYGIYIDSGTGYLYLCSNSVSTMTIFK